MRRKIAAVAFLAAALASLLPATPAAGQGFGWFATAGTGSIDYIDSREYAMQASGGGLVQLGAAPVWVGGQGDLIMKDGYASGRGGPVAQLDLLPRDAKVRPFASGGYLFADGGAQWMVGGGVDVHLSGKAGLRVAVQDAFARVTIVDLQAPGRTATTHEPSFQIGFVYR